MTALEALQSLLETVSDDRTDIEDQMKDVHPIPGDGVAYGGAEPSDKTQYDPNALAASTSSMRIEWGSVLAGKLEYNGQVHGHIRHLMAEAKT